MNILIINSSHSGGAAIASRNLFDNLLSEGHNVFYLSLYQNNLPALNAEAIFKYKFDLPPLTFSSLIENKINGKYNYFKDSNKDLKKVKSYLRKNKLKIDHISLPKTPLDITKHPFYKACDVINMHWVAGMLDYKSFFLKNNKPVVWTLHDENPYSGIFHYHPENVKFPKLVTNIDEKYFNYKRECFNAHNNITIVGLSDWIIERSKSTFFNKFSHFKIPNSIKCRVVTNQDKQIAKKVMGLEKYDNIFLFVSDGVENTRKGFQLLKEALSKLCHDFILLVVGNIKPESIEGIKSYNFGFINNRKLLEIVYTASDALLLPSLQDNLPNIMLEAYSVGTPVISFPVGGMKSHVINGLNGFLSKQVNSLSYKESIERFIWSKNEINTENIINYCDQEFSEKKQVMLYSELFESII